MDPLEVLDDYLSHFVLQHFSSRDIKIASLVSPAWYRSIGSSKCMERFWIRTGDDFYDFKRRRDLLMSQDELVKSERKYENFRAFSCKLPEYQFAAEPFKLKRVAISLCRTRPEFYAEFLNAISSNLEELSVCTNSRRYTDDSTIPDEVYLPKLKKLGLQYPSEVELEILANGKYPSLQHFNIALHHMRSDEKMMFSLTKFKSKLTKLKTLRVQIRNDFDILGFFECQLEGFHAEFKVYTEQNDLKIKIKNQVKNFLAKQKELKHLGLEDLSDIQVLHMVWYELNSLPRLSLRDDCFKRGDFKGFQELQDNFNIKQLDIWSESAKIQNFSDSNHVIILLSLIKFLPNLEILYLTTFNKTLLDYVAANLHKNNSVFKEVRYLLVPKERCDETRYAFRLVHDQKQSVLDLTNHVYHNNVGCSYYR